MMSSWLFLLSVVAVDYLCLYQKQKVFFFFNPYKVPLYLLLVKFSRQEYWSRLPFPSPGDFLNLGIEPGSPALQADSVPSEPRGKLKRVYLSVQETWVWSLIQEDPTCCGANLHHSY